MFLTTPNQVHSCEINKDDLEGSRFYCALLLRYTLRQMMNIQYEAFDNLIELKGFELVMDTITTNRQKEITHGQVDDILRAKHMVDWAEINYDGLPEFLGQIPYDPIFGHLQGAYHGLHHWINHSNTEGYFSPGQVVDIARLLEFCSYSFPDMGNEDMKEVLTSLHNIFSTAAWKKDPLLLVQNMEDLETIT